MRVSAFIALAWAAALLAGCAPVADVLSERVLATGPNGPETPDTLGVPYEHVSIPSHSRHLDGYLVRAPAGCKDPPAILIYHGFNETISKWVEAQKLLYDHCVSSLVFDPTGSGDSTHGASLAHVSEDVPSAYAFAESEFPPPTRLYLLGHSMGDALMLQAEPSLTPQPVGIIVANGFSSIRDFWTAQNVSGIVVKSMPDWWDNVQAVGRVHVPILVIHSDSDRTIPVEQAQAVYDAANQPKQLVILHGFAHNGLRHNTSETWWSAVLSFVGAPAAPAATGGD